MQRRTDRMNKHQHNFETATATDAYFTRRLIQSSIKAAISRLFFSIIIRCVLPWIPWSPSKIRSFVTPACVKNWDVQ